MNNSTFTPKTFNIYSRTNKISSEVRMSEFARSNSNIRKALTGINYARSTSRISGTDEMTIRAMSGYQFSKLVCSLANSNTKESDAARAIVDYLK